MFFDAQKFLILVKSCLPPFFLLLLLMLLVPYLIHCQIQDHEDLLLYFKSFVILALIFRLLIHFELVYGGGRGPT